MRRSAKGGRVTCDVSVCYFEPSGADLARVVAEGLSGRRFRVFACPYASGASLSADVQNQVAGTPDVVVVASPETFGTASDGRRAFDDTITQALERDANVIVFASAGAELPATLTALASRPIVRYDRSRPGESVARLAHLLTSDVEVRDRAELHSFRRWVVAAALVLLAVGGVAAARAVSRWMAPSLDVRPLPPLYLHWAAVGQRQQPDGWRPFEVTEGSQLSPGDQVKIVIAASADGYGYVVSQDAKGDIRVLFPSARASRTDPRIQAGRAYTAPVDEGWLLAPTSTAGATVYAVVSYDPVENLEALLEEHQEDATPAARQSLLESAIGGLVDGRHSVPGAVIRTRRGRPIVTNLDSPPSPMTASVTLAGGTVVTRELATLRGLQSAVSEVHLRWARLP